MFKWFNKKKKEQAMQMHIWEIDREAGLNFFIDAVDDIKEAKDTDFMVPYIIGAADIAFLMRLLTKDESDEIKKGVQDLRKELYEKEYGSDV